MLMLGWLLKSMTPHMSLLGGNRRSRPWRLLAKLEWLTIRWITNQQSNLLVDLVYLASSLAADETCPMSCINLHIFQIWEAWTPSFRADNEMHCSLICALQQAMNLGFDATAYQCCNMSLGDCSVQALALQVRDFVNRYMPAYKAYLPKMYSDGPSTAKDQDSYIIFEIDESRGLMERKIPGTSLDEALPSWVYTAYVLYFYARTDIHTIERDQTRRWSRRPCEENARKICSGYDVN